MADAMDSKSIVRKDVWVRLPPPVYESPCNNLQGLLFLKSLLLIRSSSYIFNNISVYGVLYNVV